MYTAAQQILDTRKKLSSVSNCFHIVLNNFERQRHCIILEIKGKEDFKDFFCHFFFRIYFKTKPNEKDWNFKLHSYWYITDMTQNNRVQNCMLHTPSLVSKHLITPLISGKLSWNWSEHCICSRDQSKKFSTICAASWRHETYLCPDLIKNRGIRRLETRYTCSFLF